MRAFGERQTPFIMVVCVDRHNVGPHHTDSRVFLGRSCRRGVPHHAIKGAHEIKIFAVIKRPTQRCEGFARPLQRTLCELSHWNGSMG